jgi:HNH endonuclease
MLMRRCRGCGQLLPLEAFAPHATCAGRRRHLCLDCDRERQRQRRRRMGEERAHAENAANGFARRSPLGPAGVLERPTRSEVATRHDAVCIRCGEPLDPLEAIFDHHPVTIAAGGRHELLNLRLAHRSCIVRAAAADRRRRNLETLADGSRQQRLPLDLEEQP